MDEFKTICININGTSMTDDDRDTCTLLVQNWLSYCEISPSVDMFQEMGIPCNHDSIDCDIYFMGVLRYFIFMRPHMWESVLNDCNMKVWYDIHRSVSSWLKES